MATVALGFHRGEDTAIIVRKKGAELLIVYQDRGKPDDAQQLSETTPKILHSKGGFEAFCETKLKIRTFSLIFDFRSLKAAIKALVQTHKTEKK